MEIKGSSARGNGMTKSIEIINNIQRIKKVIAQENFLDKEIRLSLVSLIKFAEGVLETSNFFPRVKEYIDANLDLDSAFEALYSNLLNKNLSGIKECNHKIGLMLRNIQDKINFMVENELGHRNRETIERLEKEIFRLRNRLQGLEDAPKIIADLQRQNEEFENIIKLAEERNQKSSELDVLKFQDQLKFTFFERAKQLRCFSWFWFAGIFIAIILSGFWIYFAYYKMGNPIIIKEILKNEGSSFIYAYILLIILYIAKVIPVFLIIRFAVFQYIKERNLFEIYNFKKITSSTMSYVANTLIKHDFSLTQADFMKDGILDVIEWKNYQIEKDRSRDRVLRTIIRDLYKDIISLPEEGKSCGVMSDRDFKRFKEMFELIKNTVSNNDK